MKILNKVLAIFLCVVMTLTATPMDSFAVNMAQSQINQGNIEIQSSNSLGQEISDLMEEQQIEENSGYCISWIDIEGKTAKVEMISQSACTVVVVIFEENGRMVGSGKTEVESGTVEAEVDIDVENMPEYFIARAFLLDENMASLCEDYLCERYTKDFREFLDLTIYDFEDQIVVQLDEEEDNNFIVARDGTQKAEQNGDKNILVSADDEAGVYVFENADKTITGVSVGQTLFYDLGNGNFILIKIESNTTEGKLTTVVAADADIDDLFDCVKIDKTSDAGQAVVDTSIMDDAFKLVVPEPEIIPNAVNTGAEGKVKLGFDVKYKNANESLKISGGFDFETSASIKLYYQVRLFKRNKVDFRLETNYGYGYKLEITAGINSDIELPLPSVVLPLTGGSNLKIELSLAFSAEGSVAIEGKKTVKSGFTYDYKNGRRDIYEEEENWTPSAKGMSFDVSIGLEVKATVSVLKIIKAGIEINVGIGVKGDYETVANKEGDNVKHLCTYCCPGECDIFANVKVFLDIGYKRLKATIFNLSVFSRRYKLFDFYFSDISAGIFATCPNYLYKVTYVVTDDNGNRLKGVAVGDIITDENGCCYTYCEPDKEYSINAVLDGYLTYSTTVDVQKAAVTVPITLVPLKMTGLSVETLPDKIHYNTGDTLDTSGLVLIAEYNSGKTETVTSGYTCTPTALNTAGTQTITVTYGDKTCTFKVNVYDVSDNDYSGTCGQNLVWIFDSLSGVLTIKGTGEMYSWDDSASIPYHKYKDSITSVVIEDGVTSICDYAFHGCTNIVSVSIGNSVRSIGYEAFYQCEKLTNITIPDSVTTIGSYLFCACISLESVKIGNGVTTIPNGTFSTCDNLNNVEIPHSVTSIGDNAFMFCYGLTNIKIGKNVNSIGKRAFDSCFYLTTVYYTGSKEEWADIKIGSDNDNLHSASIHYNYSGGFDNLYVNSEVSSFIALPDLSSSLNNSYVLTAQTSGAVEGNRYTLIALDSPSTEYSLDNLAFIDHALATGSEIAFSFMPKSAENLIVLIIGDFGSGIEQRVVKGEPGVAVTDVRLSHTSLNLHPGQDSVQLTAYITPDNASIKKVIWTSSNTSVASVDENGMITPFKPGTTTITATSASDGVSAECQVTVTARTFEISWVMPDGTYIVEYDEGESVDEYKNTDRTGYTFIGWDKTVPNRMPADNLEFTAFYKPNSYAAKFNTNGGKWADGTTAEKSVNVDFDSDIPVQSEPTKQGYIFSGWEHNGENLGANVGKMISANGMMFTAVWVPAKDTRYTVNTYTMNEKGEYILLEKVLAGTTNETATVSPEIENGFKLNEVKSVLSGIIAADNSLVLSVYIDRRTYTFTTVIDGKGTSVNYMYGEEVSEPEIPTKQGYTFSGWDSSVPKTMPAENIRLNAQWNVNFYTVTWNANGNITVDTLNYGAEIVKPKNPTKEGYTFIGWSPEIPATVPAENLTFTAQYELLAKQLKIKNPSVTTINYGETLVMHADFGGVELPEGWKIEWTVEGAGFNSAPAADGLTCKMTSVANGNATVKATLVDENGEAVLDADGNEMSDSKQLTSKAGFFQKLISFFKNLFGISRIILQ